MNKWKDQDQDQDHWKKINSSDLDHAKDQDQLVDLNFLDQD